MELHLVGIQESVGILTDMETGIEICFIPEKYKVQYADAT